MTGDEAPEPAVFRRVLGHFGTGVTVVTGTDGERPVGFACQSFAALSLDPPLVLFCPSRTSRAWPVLERAGRFCVNVLAESQRPVSTVFGRSGDDKFTGLRWHPAPSGAPILDGVLTWIDCDIEAVHEAGDHYIAIGRVRSLGETTAEAPLLFYRGAYAGLAPTPQLPPTDLDLFLTTIHPDDWL
ncbi:3-hydroxy-9,10-secoandrosta-1,3,5(10)-triene-9,17-dione monooxygenase reductase component [Saccharopolyspora shandongensis]|uniref:3-hydroxy-9,10-secoandrosta-1,3,5(10)-triene-9,17-dione monooxygenase reductase component n=1 Tax=Saccharopolyspora shandongensis TaxID=418495 RepID=A0A1H3EMT7_9PSEU|nr:3-hydroxy-9,10-secoandrosta-1,3,5(10)-triene-9,17-dione monooxygenase reductase subunit [Saccharopolyspora shandongensis]SDX79249.1 3-hydroxy-9,10-secoandrosta-1,3,5(10)-triene-9,17-dione monooxygenase reductase component [Saccharopolyspora shandongensis]